MSGRITTLRAETKTERELHKIIKRNATDAMLTVAKRECINGIFKDHGHCYRISSVYRDEINRLIVVGQLEDK